ncbi:MAG: hypothetical protein HND56_11710 [Pseudomonadota bacterium]|nr:hypothetical protein [Pseudomonadota bacterium]QKK06310.1 MAG: hypothetical protein HND56_11710 [Pseudomonadota bacterium]
MLPFTHDALTALFHNYNTGIHPAPWVMICGALLALLCLLKPENIGGWAISAILALFWMWTGGVFHMVYFTPLNFMGPVYGFFFLMQAVLFLAVGVVMGKLDFRLEKSLAAALGLLFVVLALVGYPLVEKLTGLANSDLRFAGTAPGPTALFTVGLLLTVKKRKTALLMALIPLAALGVEVYTGFVLNLPFDIYTSAAAFCAAALIFTKKQTA